MARIKRLFSCEDNGTIFEIGPPMNNQKDCGGPGTSCSLGGL